MRENEFKNVFHKGAKLPKVDTIRDTLETMDISGLRDILKYNVKKSIDNKVFDNGTIDGYTVASIDGTKFFGSNKKSCEECLKNKNHCFHSGYVMAMVGVGPKLVIDFEMYKSGIDLISKDEGDLFPVITKKDAFDLYSAKESVKRFIAELMILSPQEQDFLNRFENKEYLPELLFKDKDIIDRIKMHPMALWKIQN